MIGDYNFDAKSHQETAYKEAGAELHGDTIEEQTTKQRAAVRTVRA